MWKTGSDLKASLPFKDKKACPICSKSYDFTIEVRQEYFVLYGLRFFPLKKKFYRSCNSCQARRKIIPFDKNGRPDVTYTGLANPSYSTLKYYNGWLVLIILAVVMVYILFSAKT